jgi:hypothetical protein
MRRFRHSAEERIAVFCDRRCAPHGMGGRQIMVHEKTWTAHSIGNLLADLHRIVSLMRVGTMHQDISWRVEAQFCPVSYLV